MTGHPINDASYFAWRLYREGKIDKEKLRYERLKTVFDRLHYHVVVSQVARLRNAYCSEIHVDIRSAWWGLA